MGCGGGCGGSKSQAASSSEPREVKLPDGTKVMVTSLRQERAEIDRAHQRMRDAARAKARKTGYTTS